MKRKSIIILLIFTLIVAFCNVSSNAGGITGDAKSFLKAAQGSSGDAENPSGSDTGNVKAAIKNVSGLLMGIGVVLSVVIAAVLGIKFVMSSIEEQAKIKEAIIPYVCGCVVIFGAYGIWQLVVGILNNAM